MITTEPARSFIRAYKRLPERIQQAADQKVQLFTRFPHHPSLRLKRVGGTETLWEISINMQYRIVMECLAEDHYELVAIGTHRALDVH